MIESIKVKRYLDIIISLVMIILLSPLMIAFSFLIQFTMGRPVFFKQYRPGIHGKLFILYKFRTMNTRKDSFNNLLPDSERLTRIGKALRFSSLDELPELWNVIKGDMSLVGPRPLLRQYLDRYTPEQMRRHDVKPGITGWAQINGRNTISWEEKFALDLWYVDNNTIWLDIKIILITIWKIIKREGITQTGEATASEFFGRENQVPSNQATRE
jgi:sugar transferase EpsL